MLCLGLGSMTRDAVYDTLGYEYEYGPAHQLTSDAIDYASMVTPVGVAKKVGKEVAKEAIEQGVKHADEVKDAFTNTRQAIIDHVIQEGRHFPKKSPKQLEDLFDSTIKKGIEYPDPGGIVNRKLIYDKSTGIIIVFDGKGAGSMYRPDNPKKMITDWKGGIK